MRQQLVRQGDVLVRPTKKAPTEQAKKVIDHGRVILAYGEVTGHAHEVIGVDNTDPVPAMELFEEPDGARVLVVKRDAFVQHEEHGRVDLSPGNYEVIRQREYSPEALRNVAD